MYIHACRNEQYTLVLRIYRYITGIMYILLLAIIAVVLNTTLWSLFILLFISQLVIYDKNKQNRRWINQHDHLRLPWPMHSYYSVNYHHYQYSIIDNILTGYEPNEGSTDLPWKEKNNTPWIKSKTPTPVHYEVPTVVVFFKMLQTLVATDWTKMEMSIGIKEKCQHSL